MLVTKSLQVVLILTFFIGLAGCKQSASSNPAQSNTSSQAASLTELRKGSWGGQQASLDVSDSGAFLDLGCGSIEIQTQIRVDDLGKFAITGLYQAGGGAMPIEVFQKYPVSIHGTVSGNNLVLIYTMDAAANENILNLTFGEPSKILHCL